MEEVFHKQLDTTWNQRNVDYLQNIMKSSSELMETKLRNEESHRDLLENRHLIFQADASAESIAISVIYIDFKIKEYKLSMDKNKMDLMGFNFCFPTVLEALGTREDEDPPRVYRCPLALAAKRVEVIEDLERIGAAYITLRNKISTVVQTRTHDDTVDHIGMAKIADDLAQFKLNADAAWDGLRDLLRSIITSIQELIDDREAARFNITRPIIVELPDEEST